MALPLFFLIKLYLLFLPILTSCFCTQATLMRSTEKLLHGSAREKKKAHQNLRFSPFTAEICSRKAGACQAWLARTWEAIWQISLPAPGEKWLLESAWTLTHFSIRGTPLSVRVMNYTGTHSSMVCEHVPAAGILLPPWQSQQLKCWFDT